MGNITELKRGSLNGLRRQTNECLVNAYNKGYQDGKNEPREVKAVNVEDTSEYQIGYKVGHEDGAKWAIDENAKDHQGYYNKGYNKGLEDFENLLVYEHDYEQFFEDTYGSKDPDYNLYDLVAKYGAKKVLDDFQKWQEEKKKAEEESIKVGDEIQFNFGAKGIVISINEDWYRTVDDSGFVSSWKKGELEKTGRNFSAEVSQLLDKLKGDK